MRTFFIPASAAIFASSVATAPAAACSYEPGRVYFSSGGSSLARNGKEVLDVQVAEFFASDSADRPHRVWLTAHSESAGDPSANLTLSRRRAETVRAYLASRGISASRVDIFNLGERAARTRRDDGIPAASDRFVEVEVVTPEEVASRSSNGHCS